MLAVVTVTIPDSHSGWVIHISMISLPHILIRELFYWAYGLLWMPEAGCLYIGIRLEYWFLLSFVHITHMWHAILLGNVSHCSVSIFFLKLKQRERWVDNYPDRDFMCHLLLALCRQDQCTSLSANGWPNERVMSENHHNIKINCKFWRVTSHDRCMRCDASIMLHCDHAFWHYLLVFVQPPDWLNEEQSCNIRSVWSKIQML